MHVCVAVPLRVEGLENEFVLPVPWRCSAVLDRAELEAGTLPLH